MVVRTRRRRKKEEENGLAVNITEKEWTVKLCRELDRFSTFLCPRSERLTR